MMSVYTLTGLTGKRVVDSRVQVFAGFEAKARTWRAVIAAVGGVVLGTAISWPFLQAVGFVVGLVVGLAIFAALKVRSSEDPARLWVQVRRDKARSDSGHFFVCGHKVDPLAVETLVLAASTVPGPGYGQDPTPTDSAARAASPHASPRAPQTPTDRTPW